MIAFKKVYKRDKVAHSLELAVIVKRQSVLHIQDIHKSVKPCF
jgi:hypothetical protein